MYDFEEILIIIKKHVISIISVLIAILFVGGSIFYVRFNLEECGSCDNAETVKSERPNEEEILMTDEKSDFLKVDIKGAVKTPGVYEMENGSNIMDALKVAGGVTSKGSTANINLSKKLTDEMVIYVFTKDELKKKEVANEVVCEVPKCECETVTVTECPTVNGSTNKPSSDTSIGKVSINSATLEQFLTLDGIGESKAKTIIEYREKNGPFTSIEDIKKVSGIGDILYEKIKDKITV